MSHPYENLPGYRFWSEAVANCNPAAIDPVTRGARIEPDHKVSTLGSCFAQHLSRHIADAGLCYFVPEAPPAELDADQVRRRGFGIYSARYGNVYTPRQALQLFDRAFGRFEPADDVWTAGSRFVDAFRPGIEPDGFETPRAVRAEAKRHLGHVRRVFRESDWLVFTLGLTECWQSRVDGAVYPQAPGVTAGTWDPDRYAFKNLDVQEVIDDLGAFVERVRAENETVRILLTVSPVALIATGEDRHVLSSTVCSKSILRAAADEMERRFEGVIYFPSYEIVTSPASEGRYYCDDLRQVTALGVQHVMRVFGRHFVRSGPRSEAAITMPAAMPAAVRNERDVICDEDEIEFAVFGAPRR